MFKNKKNLRFIKKQMENNAPNIPSSLDEKNIRNLIDDEVNMNLVCESFGTAKKHIKFKTKSIISIAACTAVAITSVAINFSMNKYNTSLEPDDIIVTENSENGEESESHPFKSYDELLKYIKKMQNGQERFFEVAEDNVKSDIAADPGIAVGASMDGETSYESTYTQVKGVDEGDIIKNDGKYIYVVNSDYKYFYEDTSHIFVGIYETDQENVKLISKIDSFKHKDCQTIVKDIYLYQNKLVVLSEYIEDSNYCEKTAVTVYDISDKTAPKKIKSFSQEGYYLSSRIVGNHLYFISNKYVSLWYDTQKDFNEDCIPKYSYDDGKEKKIGIKDVYCVKKPTEPNYVITSSIDLDKNDKYTDTKAILGAGDEVYCNQDNLYVLCSNYAESSYDQTEIIKFSIDNGIIKFKTSQQVIGTINNQYSLDEKDGNLRIATSYYDRNGDEYNAIYVLDENLKEIGKVKGFAKDETIQAVRYIGNMAYVITYEQTDPLFIIDLSDPEKPEIKGSVKISGFSSMLHPVDENTLLGVGYSTDSTEWGEATNGIKIALFDISNSTKPKVLDSKVIKNYSSEAQNNPKALVVNDDKGYFAIPISADEAYDSGAQIFTVENGKINFTQSVKINDPNSYITERCTYIDDFLYLISYDYNESFSIEGHKIN